MRVAGFGFRTGADAGALAAAFDSAGGGAAEGGAITAIATAEDKAGHAAIIALAARLGLPLIAVPLAAVATAPAAPSPKAPARYGGKSLAEAAALAASGPGARLIARRATSPCRRATCAIAERAAP